MLQKTKMLILLVILFIIASIILVSCTKFNITKQKVENKENSENVIDISELKKVIISSINDDIWYNGKNSIFFGFQNQKSKIEIYLNSEAPDTVSVIFDNRFNHGNNSVYKDNEYYAIYFWRGEKGYDNEPSGSIEEINLSVLKKRLEKLGFSFQLNSEIEIGPVLKPKYPLTSVEREKVVSEIEEDVYKRLKEWKGTGEFLIYIRNFKKNDYSTYVVIGNAKGRTWILDVALEDNGHVSTGKFREVEVDSYEYTANQYKKVAIANKKIYIH